INRFPLGDVDNFSVCRHAYAECQRRYFGKSSGAAKALAPWEYAYHAALEELATRKAQGEYVSSIDGGALAPEAWSKQWSDLLRAFRAVGKLPVTKLFVPYRIDHLPKVTGDVTISYPGENNPIPATQFQFGQISYTARKAAATIGVSNETIRDAPFLADHILPHSTPRAISYAPD